MANSTPSPAAAITPPWGSDNKSVFWTVSARCAPLPDPLGGVFQATPKVHISRKFHLRGATSSLPFCELLPGSRNKVRILTLGVWILLPGGSLCPGSASSLAVVSSWGIYLNLALWRHLLSDLSTGRHFLGSLTQPSWRRGWSWWCLEFGEGISLYNSHSTGEGTHLWIRL